MNDDVLLAQDQATVCPTHLERGYLYQLAYDWLSRDKDGATTTPDSEQMNKMFIQLWKCKIQDCIENGKVGNCVVCFSYTLNYVFVNKLWCVAKILAKM